MHIKICSNYSKYCLKQAGANAKQAVGFTLFELLISLSIVSIVCLFALPYWSSFYQNYQLQVRQHEIQQAVRFAKMQAQLMHQSLLLVPIDGRDDWSFGMRLLVDNAQHRYTPEALVLHEWHWHHSMMTIRWHGFQSNGYLLFANHIRNYAVNGYFLMQTHQGRVVKLIVNRLGDVRVGA